MPLSSRKTGTGGLPITEDLCARGAQAAGPQTLQELCAVFESDLRRVKECVEQTLTEHRAVARALPGEGESAIPPEFPIVEEMVSHLLRMEGKWLRAIVLLASVDLCRGERSRAVPVASAIEMIHLASLIHDDVIDQGETRRGMPSLGNAWGPTAAILMGDFLYNEALYLMARRVPPAVLQDVLRWVNDVCYGEVSQHQFSAETPPTEREYLHVIRNKTASLFAAATRGGALMAGAPEDIVRTLGDFGLGLGIGFQIADDLLDLTGNSELLGKPMNADLCNSSWTLPLIYYAARGETEKKLAIKALRPGADAERLLPELKNSGALEKARTLGLQYVTQACATLRRIPEARREERAVELLTRLSFFALERRR